MKDTEHKYITYRADRGKYQITLPVTIPDLKSKRGVRRTRIIKQATTLEEAVAERDRLMKLYRMDATLLAKVVNPVKEEPDNRDFGQEFMSWYMDTKEPALAAASFYKYRKAARYIMTAFGGQKVRDISRDLIQALLESAIRKTTKKNAAVCLTLLKQFYVHIGISPAPCESLHVSRPQAGFQKKEALTVDEVNKILDHIDKYHSDKSFLFRMYFITGCRRGELLGLTWEYVDFDNKCIYIRKTLVKDELHKTIILQDKTKTPASRRVIYLPPQAMATLKNWKHLREPQGLAKPADFVFLNRGNRPFWPDDITEYFRRARVAVGIKKHVTLHSTRHTFATNLALQGVPLFVIQALGGWGNARVLQESYMHTHAERVREYMDKTDVWKGFF